MTKYIKLYRFKIRFTIIHKLQLLFIIDPKKKKKIEKS